GWAGGGRRHGRKPGAAAAAGRPAHALRQRLRRLACLGACIFHAVRYRARSSTTARADPARDRRRERASANRSTPAALRDGSADGAWGWAARCSEIYLYDIGKQGGPQVRRHKASAVNFPSISVHSDVGWAVTFW